MQGADLLAGSTTPGGLLLVMAIIVPAVGILLQLVLGASFTNRIAVGTFSASLIIAAAVFAKVWISDESLIYIVGGWSPPLGVSLRADGISAVMILATALIMCATGLFASADFKQPGDEPEQRAPFVFWPLLYGIWSGLNTVFVSGDLFTLYVALELLTFAAVPLVSLKGSEETVRAALRYLLFALLGSMFYLLGTAVLYGGYGTLDLALLSKQVRPEPVAWMAAALMTMGLLAKTALYPLHLWLPPAHSGAPAAGSAILSALVIKGSFFLAVRLWFDAMPELGAVGAANLLGIMGCAAVIFGGVLALRQKRLKLLVAYSTVSQIGYLFFLFPLAIGAKEFAGDLAWTGGWLQVLAHAFAKAAMFMAVGLIAEAFGHDRFAEFGGATRVLPLTMATFALSGLSLIGIPPSGGFSAKWLLLLSSLMQGQWWLAIVMLAGGLLAGGYIFNVLGKVFSTTTAPVLVTPIARSREVVPLLLAVCAILLGFVPLEPSELLQVGRAGFEGAMR